ncbi:MAG: enolase [Patescibacteria group bacterium]|nr:MAG: enolase [Patescibacteria group bacterium]
MSKIQNIIAREIINARGYPTIEAKIILDNQKEAYASFASFEQLFPYQNKELKDNDEKRFKGAGVQTAVYYINNLIAPKLKGVDISKQYEIDNWLISADSTKDKRKLGVNTIMTISLLVAKAAALNNNQPLYLYFNNYFNKVNKTDLKLEFFPSPIFSLLKGGRHGQINLDFQEFQIVPSSSFTYSKAYELGVDLYHQMRHLYKFQFNFNLDVLSAIKESIEKKELRFGHDVFLSIHFGANNYFSANHYYLKDKDSMSYVEYYQFLIEQIIKKYTPLVVIDCFSNNDLDNWKKAYDNLNKDTYLSIDELIFSNKNQLEKYIKDKLFTTVVIRPNQIGTITEIVLMIDYLKKNQLSFIIASEIGETNENYLADLSVGLDAEFVLFGPPVHGENVAKYNRLLEIEKELIKK